MTVVAVSVFVKLKDGQEGVTVVRVFSWRTSFLLVYELSNVMAYEFSSGVRVS